MSTAIVICTIVVVVVGICFWLLSRVADLKSKLGEPVVVAAIVAAITAGSVALVSMLGAVVSSAIASSNQKDAEIEKLRATIVLSVLQQYEPTMVASGNERNQKQRMTMLIQSGIIPDHDGRICMAVIKEGCPIKVLKAPSSVP